MKPSDVDPQLEPLLLEPTPTSNGNQLYIEDEVLFVAIVEHLKLPVPVRQLPRHLQKRLEVFFKFAVPVPPCHRCSDTCGVRFRYFNNANKSLLLQPRYQCFSPCCCTTDDANPKSGGMLMFTLNHKKYTAHLQLHGGLYTILENNSVILNNSMCSGNLCPAATSYKLPVGRHHKSSPTAAPSFLPAGFQSPPTMGYSFDVGANWTATAAAPPMNTAMNSIFDERAAAWDHFRSDPCYESRQEDTLMVDTSSANTRAFQFPAGVPPLPHSISNAHDLNLADHQSGIIESLATTTSVPNSRSFTAEELEESLKILESLLEEDIRDGARLNQDHLKSNGLPDLDPIDLLDLDFIVQDSGLEEGTINQDVRSIDFLDLYSIDLPDLVEPTIESPDQVESSIDLPDLDLIVQDSGLEEGIINQDVQSIDFPNLYSIDLSDLVEPTIDSPDQVESFDLSALDFDPNFSFEASSYFPLI